MRRLAILILALTRPPLVLALREIVDRDRPPAALAIAHPGGPSCPSGHPFAAELFADMLSLRLETQSRNLRTYLGSGLRDGLTPDEAAERYSALLSPELHHLLTVDRGWSQDRYEAWVAELLVRDLLP